MSSAAQTKIFGIRLGVDPKILVGVLVALAGLMFWYNSRGDDEPAGSSSASHAATPAAVPATVETAKNRVQRRRSSRDDRSTLRLRNIDPSHGDIDPELRLDLLQRLANVKAPSAMRNLFESGPATQAGGPFAGMPNRVIATTKPVVLPPVQASYPVMPKIEANIPLKYYGFVKPVNSGDGNRGFFLDGDNILVATEGQLVQQRYMVVQLNPLSARLEDTQIKMGQTLPVVPEAIERGGSGFGGPINQPGFQQETNEENQEEQPQQGIPPGQPPFIQQQPQGQQPGFRPGFQPGARGIGLPPSQGAINQ